MRESDENRICVSEMRVLRRVNDAMFRQTADQIYKRAREKD
jgi:hypothetical protein